MVLLGDEAQVKAQFSPFRDNANLAAKIGARFVPNYHILRNSFGRTRWNS
jgi:hypothetical protein